MSPVEVFATRIKIFDRQRVCLITWSYPSEALDRLIFNVSKRSNCSCVSWSFDFRSSEATLMPWSALKMGFDRLIQFWSWSQTLLHGTYKWLPLVVTFCHGDKLIVTSFLTPQRVWLVHQWVKHSTRHGYCSWKSSSVANNLQFCIPCDAVPAMGRGWWRMNAFYIF